MNLAKNLKNMLLIAFLSLINVSCYMHDGWYDNDDRNRFRNSSINNMMETNIPYATNFETVTGTPYSSSVVGLVEAKPASNITLKDVYWFSVNWTFQNLLQTQN